MKRQTLAKRGLRLPDLQETRPSLRVLRNALRSLCACHTVELGRQLWMRRIKLDAWSKLARRSLAEVAIKSDLFADVFRMIAALQQNLIRRPCEALGCHAFDQTNEKSAFR